MAPGLPAQSDREFDDVVDQDGPIYIRGKPFTRSEVLASDPVAYAEALSEYRIERRTELLDAVMQRFPFPVAHCLYRYQNSAQSENVRLQFLKDTWESVIALLFAIAVAEVRTRAIRVQVESKPAEFRRLLDSRNLRDRLEVLATTLGASPGDSVLRSLVDAASIENLIKLNKTRNEDLAHIATLNEEQSMAIVDKVEPVLLTVLRRSSALESMDLARYLGPSAKHGQTRLEVFRGHETTRRIEIRALSPALLSGISRCSTSEVLLICGESVLPLTPAIAWREGTGHRSKLAWMKKRRNEDGRDLLTFEVFGDAEEFEDGTDYPARCLGDIKRFYVGAKERS